MINECTFIQQTSKNKFNKQQELFLCGCGNKFETVISAIKIGHTRSCGCLKKKSCRNRPYKPNNIRAKNQIFIRYKRGAKQRGHIFDLTLNDVNIITQMPCNYCGTINSNCLILTTTNGIRKYHYNGIDRVDNNLGYTSNNIVPCCNQCNHAKRDMTKDQFLDLIDKIYNHTIKNSAT